VTLSHLQVGSSGAHIMKGPYVSHPKSRQSQPGKVTEAQSSEVMLFSMQG
jgi:hypothetical protein